MVPAFTTYTPPLICQTMTCIFGARATRPTFMDPPHDVGTAEGVKGVFTCEQLL